MPCWSSFGLKESISLTNKQDYKASAKSMPLILMWIIFAVIAIGRIA